MRIRETAPSSGMTSASTRRVDLERFEAQLAEWTALIGQCRASARRVEAQARMELDRLTDELLWQRNEAGAQVLRLKNTADAEWEHEKAQLERSWQAVRTSFQRVQARF